MIIFMQIQICLNVRRKLFSKNAARQALNKFPSYLPQTKYNVLACWPVDRPSGWDRMKSEKGKGEKEERERGRGPFCLYLSLILPWLALPTAFVFVTSSTVRPVQRLLSCRSQRKKHQILLCFSVLTGG